MIHSTQRCIIHHLSSADIPDAIQLFTNKQVRKYLGGTLTEQQAKEKLRQWANNQDGRYYCIRCRYSNAFIGIVSVTDHHDGKYQELSYQYLPQWWEQGIAKETLHELLQYFKSSFMFADLVAETQAMNERSCKLLEKLGFSLHDTIFRFGAEQRIYRITL